jgi:hypothetical protein
MRRREFITLLGGTAAAWPHAAQAQQEERMHRIGVLLPAAMNRARLAGHSMLHEYWQVANKLCIGEWIARRLKDAGFVEGQNVAIDYRWGNDRFTPESGHSATTMSALCQKQTHAPQQFRPLLARLSEALDKPGLEHRRSSCVPPAD